MAWVLYHAKRYDAAAKAYGEVIQKYAADYDSPAIREVLRDARMSLSNVFVAQHDNDRAIECLQQVLDEFPDDAGGLNDLGYLWANLGKHLALAHGMIQRAVDQEPENAAYRDSLGWVLFREGRLAEALPELEKAVALQTDPAVLDHLGDAYRTAGQPDRAKDAWLRALAAFQKSGDPDDIKKVEDKIKSIP